jgi:SpoVK/Ycf46/Vps4 family AAA+-type ATPase
VTGLDERERQKLIPRGFIFHGPPGTGKTLFAKAIANEMNATIQMVSGPEIMDKYVGQSESNLRHIFATARRNAPSVIFFDEFDSIASQRSTYSDGGSRANNAVVAQMLTELDGFREDQTVLVIGTSNRIDIIDEALLRPSRLRPIEIQNPDYTARRSVAAIHAKKFGVDTILQGLCALACAYLPVWAEDAPIPPDFIETLFAQHPAHKDRYEQEGQVTSFLRELQAFFKLVHEAQQHPAATDEPGQATLTEVKLRLVEIAQAYGLDLTQAAQADPANAEQASLLQPVQADLVDLFRLLHEQQRQSSSFTPEAFVSSIMDLIAEYTEGFNNDEIRAIFQEASLEYHLDGLLVTPRYLGMKVGLIRKRRDERQVVHLTDARRRR